MAETAAGFGIALMPWQTAVVDVAFEVDGDGRLVYRDCDVAVPRQSGKTTLLAAVALHRLLSAPNQRIAYVPQSRLAGRDKLFRTFWPMIRSSPHAGLFELRRATGEEAIETANGGVWHLLSSEECAGHGMTLDLGLCDETWTHTAAVEAALRPAMVSRANGQIWRFSTAGTARSTYWHDRVASGRTAATLGMTEDVAYFEWSAPEGADVGDPEVWKACMPALGHTAAVATVAKDRASMQPDEFVRGYLNWLPGERADTWSVIDRDTWESLRL